MVTWPGDMAWTHGLDTWPGHMAWTPLLRRLCHYTPASPVVVLLRVTSENAVPTTVLSRHAITHLRLVRGRAVCSLRCKQH